MSDSVKAHKFSVAPMLDWTDRHCRYFHSLLSQKALLYTEMVTTGAMLNGDRQRFLPEKDISNPVAYQLGGSEPEALAKCAQLIESTGYDEVNLNVGCPSDRVQNGRFGACLMAEPLLVAECVEAMRENVSIPVTVKSRIGIDDKDSYQELVTFISTIAEKGCDTFIVHARKAWLKGLSPKQNREIPPLRYEVVYQLKKDFPQLNIVINGGVSSIAMAFEHLSHVDGVMIGREAYHNPFILAEVDSRIYSCDPPALARHDIVMRLIPYIRARLAEGVRLHSMTRHILGLFHGEKGARAWRRVLSEKAPKFDADESVVLEALSHVSM